MEFSMEFAVWLSLEFAAEYSPKPQDKFSRELAPEFFLEPRVKFTFRREFSPHLGLNLPSEFSAEFFLES